MLNNNGNECGVLTLLTITPNHSSVSRRWEVAAINKYSRNFPAALFFFRQGASLVSLEAHFLFTLVYSSPTPPPPEAYAVYFYVFPSEFPDFPEIESSAR